MRRSIAQFFTVAAAAAALGIVGCSSTPKSGSGTGQTPSGAGEFTSGEAIQETVTTEVDELKTVYFDFDRYNIRSDQQQTLRADAKVVMAKQELGVVTLQGNTDERGSQEYNLALGERRANSVRRYLIDLGAPSSRLRTVSFGEDRPAVPGHDESAWRWNRRVDFAVSR